MPFNRRILAAENALLAVGRIAPSLATKAELARSVDITRPMRLKNAEELAVDQQLLNGARHRARVILLSSGFGGRLRMANQHIQWRRSRLGWSADRHRPAPVHLAVWPDRGLQDWLFEVADKITIHAIPAADE
uniref:hypothetical protein n=1 Tax=Sphingomonas bacterium TaxID=1895847 RepID=UPI002622DEFA|nr:hypothetical protein [Sphingomonas bacterium]